MTSSADRHMNWTAEIIDDVLETLLPLTGKRQYEQALRRIAEHYKVGVIDCRVGSRLLQDGDPVNRMLWGQCTGVRVYEGPAGTNTRTRRTGPLSWVEGRCVVWALKGESTQQYQKPNAEYLSRLLQRDVEGVEKAMLQLGPARGRQGLLH